MTAKRHPSDTEFAMLDAMFSDNPEAWDNWVRSQGYQPDPDLPVCLASIPPDQWVSNSKVLPPPGVQAYLDSGDTLTNHAIDMMEDTIERIYGVTAPWMICSSYIGREEDGNLTLEYFYLLLDRSKQKALARLGP